MTKGDFMEGTEALQAYFNRDYDASELQKIWQLCLGYEGPAFLAACSHAMKHKEFLPTPEELLAFTDSLSGVVVEKTKMVVKTSAAESEAKAFAKNVADFLDAKITRRQFADTARELCKEGMLKTKIDVDSYWAKHGMALDEKPKVIFGRLMTNG